MPALRVNVATASIFGFVFACGPRCDQQWRKHPRWSRHVDDGTSPFLSRPSLHRAWHALLPPTVPSSETFRSLMQLPPASSLLVLDIFITARACHQTEIHRSAVDFTQYIVLRSTLHRSASTSHPFLRAKYDVFPRSSSRSSSTRLTLLKRDLFLDYTVARRCHERTPLAVAQLRPRKEVICAWCISS